MGAGLCQIHLFQALLTELPVNFSCSPHIGQYHQPEEGSKPLNHLKPWVRWGWLKIDTWGSVYRPWCCSYTGSFLTDAYHEEMFKLTSRDSSNSRLGTSSMSQSFFFGSVLFSVLVCQSVLPLLISVACTCSMYMSPYCWWAVVRNKTGSQLPCGGW